MVDEITGDEHQGGLLLEQPRDDTPHRRGVVQPHPNLQVGDDRHLLPFPTGRQSGERDLINLFIDGVRLEQTPDEGRADQREKS